MLILPLLLALILPANNQPSQINMFVAVQTVQEQHMSYLPYFSTCDYDFGQFIPGSATTTPISEETLFQNLLIQDNINFWAPVYQGFDIGYIINFVNIPNQGYILYDSKIQNFNRRVILFQYNNSQLTFFSTFLIPNVTNNSVQTNNTQTIIIDLPEQAQSILSSCSNISKTNFGFLGGKHFLFACGELKAGFIFVPGQNSSTVQIVNFTINQSGSYQLATNPALYNYKSQQSPIFWSILLLVSNSTQSSLYFISHQNQNNTLNVTPISDFYNQMRLVINRIWGQQIKQQVNRWMGIYKFLDVDDGLYIPGVVVSVFISIYDIIYVESIEDNLTYICIFDNQGNIYSNLSTQGSVVSYGSDATFIYKQDTKQLFKLSIQRPIYIINPLDFGNLTIPNTFSFTSIKINCTNITVVVNYQILWTSFQYPSGYIFSLDNNEIYSADSVISLQTDQKFLIVGPDFQIIPSLTNTIQVEVYDSSTVEIQAKAIGVLNFYISSQGVFAVVIITNNGVWQVNSHGQSSVLVNQPCGFKNITEGHYIGKNLYQFTNGNNMVCQCSITSQVCYITNTTQQQPLFSTEVTQIPEFNLNLGGTVYLNSSNLAQPSGQSSGKPEVYVKKNLFGLIKYGYIIVITENNQAVLINATSRAQLFVMTINCGKKNMTNGVIFTQQFYLPSLFLYCQGQNTISQIIVLNNQLYFERKFNLYGFFIGYGDLKMKTTTSYIFLEVQRLQKESFYPQVEGCCVLRLDPSQFTVSFIAQIILADSIIEAATFNGYEVGIFSVFQNLSVSTLVKIYLPNQWISFNYTNPATVILPSQQVAMSILSPYYNFASIFNVTITFNLTDADLSLIYFNKQKTLTIPLNILNSSKYGETSYGASVVYNMSQFVCGPIFNSYFSPPQNTLYNFIQIGQTEVLTSTKVIGGIYIDFLQIINPQNWNQEDPFSFNDLLLFISVDRIYAYAKILNNVQMVLIKSLPLPEKSCTYYLYNILNETSVNLTSICFGINFQLLSPSLIINYNPNITNSSNFTMTYQYFPNYQNLRDVETLPTTNQTTYIVGILVGPMSTQTGRLILCLQRNCSSLHVSTVFSFLVNYATFNSDIFQAYFIFTIDMFQLGVYFNPTVQPDNQSQIDPDYSFAYSFFIGEAVCSALKVLNATYNFSEILLSCYSSYYYLLLNYTDKKIYVLGKFSRYSQCALLDDFQPQAIYKDQKLLGFFAQCRSSDNSENTNAYTTIKSDFNTRYTGYLQVFTTSGPRGPNCSNQSFSPIKIIRISTSMNRPLFKSYHMNSSLKFLYCDLNGALIDNFVTTQPKLNILFSPLQSNQISPEITFFVNNQFYSKVYLIETTQKPGQVISPTKYIAVGFYCLANLTTLIFMYCFCTKKKNQQRFSFRFDEDSQYDAKQKNEELVYEQEQATTQKRQQQQSERKSQMKTVRQSSQFSRVSEIQMFFMKGRLLIN